jgi:hypothetical protein
MIRESSKILDDQMTGSPQWQKVPANLSRSPFEQFFAVPERRPKWIDADTELAQIFNYARLLFMGVKAG